MGIGLEFCRSFKEKGDIVIGLCRRSSSELNELGIKVYENIDVRSIESLVKCVKALQGIAVDLLVNNAGYLHRDSLEDINFDEILHHLK
jgi:short-subunit dehydrogenase